MQNHIEHLLSSKNICLLICKLIIPPQTVIGKIFAKPLAKGFRKTSNDVH